MEAQPSLFDDGRKPMKDVKFMTAKEKEKVLKQWEAFLKNGCIRLMFTKQLYHHLIMHCSFIAHYDINGFYATYFEQGDDTINFLSQFDNRNGIPKSVELGMYGWYTDSDYHDLNSAMCQVASKYIPHLIQEAEKKQRERDLTLAELLLAKHGINVKID